MCSVVPHSTDGSGRPKTAQAETSTILIGGICTCVTLGSCPTKVFAISKASCIDDAHSQPINAAAVLSSALAGMLPTVLGPIPISCRLALRSAIPQFDPRSHPQLATEPRPPGVVRRFALSAHLNQRPDELTDMLVGKG